MRHLDLFSGIGGFALAARRVGWETVGFCEIDPYCQKVLAKNFPGVPIHGDIKTYDGQECDIITGGFPCQPYSVAGKRRGGEDDRALWPEYRRIISGQRPRWVVGENVVGIIDMELDKVLFDLEDLGYAVDVFVIPASAVGAAHRRDRVWILADSKYGADSSIRRAQGEANGLQGKRGEEGYPRGAAGAGNDAEVLADANGKGLQGWEKTGNTEGSGEGREEQPAGCGERSKPGNWLPEPRVGRVAHGIPKRVDRIKGLGNAIVPQIAEVIFRAINKIDTGD